MRARYYSPQMRRFINADILAGDIANTITLNRYAYANANPVSYVDPLGRSADERGDTQTMVIYSFEANAPKVRLGTGIWSLKNDPYGIAILLQYLYGDGEKVTLQDSDWAQYMMANKGDPDDGIDPLGKQVADIVFQYGESLKKGESITVDITTHMEMENGEDIIGYQYLHGTNAGVGDFQIKGTISADTKGNITYDLTYTWNDRIDPNFYYDSDKAKVEFAKKIPYATLNDYDISIIWSDKTVIKANEKWFNRSYGWLSKYD